MRPSSLLLTLVKKFSSFSAQGILETLDNFLLFCSIMDKLLVQSDKNILGADPVLAFLIFDKLKKITEKAVADFLGKSSMNIPETHGACHSPAYPTGILTLVDIVQPLLLSHWADPELFDIGTFQLTTAFHYFPTIFLFHIATFSIFA